MIVVMPATSAWAQDSGEGLFQRDRNVSVKERPKPGYQTDGIRSGSFWIKPELTLQAEFDDNIFATDVNEESDVIAVLAPSVKLESDFSRHAIEAFADLESRQYSDFDSESRTDFGVGTKGILDVQRGTKLEAGAEYRQMHENRTAAGVINGALEPIEYQRTNFFINGSRESGRARLEATADFSKTNFDNAILAGGAVGDQNFRDVDELQLGLRGDYAISPDTSVFARIRYSDRENDTLPNNGVTRDQTGYIIDVGADFDLTNSVRGEVGIGYIKQNYDAPLLDDFDGLSYTGSVEWFATPLITVVVDGSRTARPSGLLASPGFVDTRVGVSADYEWRRNIIFSSGYSYRDENYQGIDRSDNRNSLFIGGTYLMNRYVGFSANYIYSDLNSSGAFSQADYGINKILFGITLRR
jgi:hypothetical protein